MKATSRMEPLDPRRLFSIGQGFPATISGPGFESIDQTQPLADGGVMVAGLFNRSSLVEGEAQRQSVGETDVFIARTRADGSVRWLRTFGSDANNRFGVDNNLADFAARTNRAGEPFIFGVSALPRGQDETVSSIRQAADGSIWVAGNFQGTIDFDGNGPLAPLTSPRGDYFDGYVIRYSPNGVIQSLWQVGGLFSDNITDMEIGDNGDIYLSGLFSRNADFDVGPGQDIRNPRGRSDGYVARYSPEGKLRFFESFGGDADRVQQIEGVNGIAIDAEGSTYATGVFSERSTLGSGSASRIVDVTDEGRSSARTDSFTVKLFPSGRVQWLTTQGADDYDGNRDIALLNAGVYTVGYFKGEAGLDPSNPGLRFRERSEDNDTGELTDLFLTRLNLDGSIRYVKQIGGSKFELVGSLKASPAGTLVLGGSFYRDMNVSLGRTPLILQSPSTNRSDANQGERDNAYSAFLVEYTPNGVVLQARQIDGRKGQDVFMSSFSLTETGQAIVSGRFRAGVRYLEGQLTTANVLFDSSDREDGFVVSLQL